MTLPHTLPHHSLALHRVERPLVNGLWVDVPTDLDVQRLVQSP